MPSMCTISSFGHEKEHATNSFDLDIHVHVDDAVIHGAVAELA